MWGNHTGDTLVKDAQFKDDLSEVVANIYPVISSQLGNFASDDNVAEVAQTTWESAWRSRKNYDPEKGTLHSWVVSIARKRAIDLFNRRLKDLDNQKTNEMLAGAGDRSDPLFAVEAEDHADHVIGALDATHEVTTILQVVEDVIQNPVSTARGLSLILVFDDDLDLASKSLGVSHDALRRARRELILCCQVVANAQRVAADNEQPVTLRTLIECLPEMTEAGDWTRELAIAVAMAGGFENVTISHVMDVTGYSYNTARQYLVQSTHLIQVAATVIHRFIADNNR